MDSNFQKKMALLLCSHPLSSFPSSSSTSSSSSILPISATPVCRLSLKPIDPHPKSFNGIRILTPFMIKKTGGIIVKASSDIDGTGGVAEPSSETKEEVVSKEEAVPVGKLPLESKQQERLEQKIRMKLAKKIRLRRKRLVRKRRLRKKGRWPPSKMNKLKNV